MDPEDDVIFEKTDFEGIVLPKDADGYVQSFDYDETYGFVCISNVLEQPDIEGSINEVWEFLERDNEHFDRNDTSTWCHTIFRSSPLGIVGGQPAFGPYAWKNRQNEKLYKVFSILYGTDALWVSLDRWGLMRPTVSVPHGKLNKNKYRTTTENEDAIEEGVGDRIVREREGYYKRAEITRNMKQQFLKYVLMIVSELNTEKAKETRNTISEEEMKAKIEEEFKIYKEKVESELLHWKPEKLDRNEWRTKASWLHWDLNPWAWVEGLGVDYRFDDFIIENNGSKNTGCGKLQGILNLVDSRDEDGGFLCVPGFQQFLPEFVEKTKNTKFAQKSINNQTFSFISLPLSSSLKDRTQKITARAGTLVVWSSELLHCNYPNTSSRLRINQYVKMFPAQEGGQGVNQRKKIIKEILEQKKIEVTEIGKKVFGLESYQTQKNEAQNGNNLTKALFMIGAPLLIVVLSYWFQ